MEKTTSKTRRFTPNICVGAPGLGLADLRRMAQSEPEGFMAKAQALIDSGDLRWNKIHNLRNLFLATADVEVEAHVAVLGEQRAIMASAFPLLAGGMTVAGMQAAYEAVPTIGQDLVSEMEDNKKISIVAAVHTMDTDIDRVDEGVEFPEIGASEEKYEIRHKRNGRRFSITAETIEENDIPDIVRKVDALGEIPAESIEEQTLRRVCDIDGSGTSPAEPYVMRLNGAGTQLYNSTANNPGTRAPSGTRVNNNALADESDLNNVRAVLAAMLNSRLKRIAIPISRCTLLVPDALAGVANKILLSELTPGVENEINNWGPRGRYRPIFRSSPKLDDLSTTAWYMGWFEKQFLRKWKLRFEYVTLSGTTEAFLRRRIAFEARVAWDCEIGATDYVYCVQSLTGTTPP